MRVDQTLAAIGFAVLNAFMLAGMSLAAKWLGEYYGAIEVTFWRNTASLVLLLLVFLSIRNFHFWKTQRPWAHVFRSTIGTAGIAFGMYTVSILSLAETTLLLFTSPLFTVLLSAIFLKERIGIYRIGAVVIGFVGVAVASSHGEFSLPLIGLITGLCWGFLSGAVDVTLRWMGDTENSYTTTFYFMLIGGMACGLYWPYSANSIDFTNQNDAYAILGIIVFLGVTGTVALLAKTQSYRLGEASLIAPIMYTMLIWSVIFDALFWGRTPTWNVILGAGIIIGANLFITYRQHVKSKVRSVTIET